MADNKRRGRFGKGPQDGQSIFDLFEPPPEQDTSSFGKIPIIRDEEETLDLTDVEFVEAQAAAEAEAAGLAHWTEPATGQVPAALGSDRGTRDTADVKGPSWHGEDPNWEGPDLSDVFADTEAITHDRLIEVDDDDDLSIDPSPTQPPGSRRPAPEPRSAPSSPRPAATDRPAPVAGRRRGGQPARKPSDAPSVFDRPAGAATPPPAPPAPKPGSSPGLFSRDADAGSVPAPTRPARDRSPDQAPSSPPPVSGAPSERARAAVPPPSRAAAAAPKTPSPPPVRTSPTATPPPATPPPATPPPATPSPATGRTSPPATSPAPPRATTPPPAPTSPEPGILSADDGRRGAHDLPSESPDAAARAPLPERPARQAPTPDRIPAPEELSGRGQRLLREPPAEVEDFEEYDEDGLEEEYEDFEADGGGGGRSMGQSIVVGIALAALVFVTLGLGPVPTMILVGLLTLLAVMELFNAMRVAGLRPATLLGLVGAVALPAATFVRGEAGYPLVVGLAVVFGMLWYLTGADTERPVLNLGLTLTGIMWVGGLAGFAALMLRSDEGIGLLLATIIITAVSDTLAYLGGRAYGTKSFHSASPNKTWEGTLTGFFGALFAGLVIGVTDLIGVFDGQFISVMVLAAVVGVLAPIGDLAESLVKRDLGIKDMGTLLPGHGGVLDRVDGLLFALPGAYYVAVVYQLI